MAFFDDMAAAIETYPETDVVLEIVEVDTPGDALNEGEVASFRVKVTNRGPLHLDGVTLRVAGVNGATVANNGAAAPFVSEFVTQELPRVRARGGSELTVGSPLKFKAPPAPQTAKNLVRVSLEAWDANLDHILLARSDPNESVKTTFVEEVVAS